MKKQTFTKEQKAEYFKGLREEWLKVKKMSEGDEKARAEFAKLNLQGVSYINFRLVAMQMDDLGFDGIPCVDCKTFQGWKNSGFQVKKGEKSKIHAITWIGNSKNDDEEDSYIFPKQYNLFHKSQVEEIKE